MALKTLYVVQNLQHYMLLQKIKVIVNSNPMKHILSNQIIRGKYSKWIVDLQEFALDLLFPNLGSH